MNAILDFVHKFVPGSSERTLLLLHGTGGNESDLIPLGQNLDPAAALLSPRGKVLENGRPRFFRRLAEGVFDEEDLIHRTHELADFVIAASAHYKFDPKRVIAVGYSNGANIAVSLLLLRPETLNAAILFRSMVPLVPKQLPDLARVQILIAAGKHDPIASAANTQRLVALLQQSGAKVSARFAEAAHELTDEDIETARQWLEKENP
jgi:phospholipase/carboxylesterase